MSSKLNAFLAYIESLHPKNIALGLARATAVFKKINRQKQFSCPVVTVAGTNGKGSTVAALTQIALDNNLNIGAYTSPHIYQFNERIQINNKPLDDEAILVALQKIDKARGDIQLTYFEFATLAALYVFAQSDLDLIILEVGLGGRLDATNIVDTDIAVITSIAKDHTDWLGETLEEIAREKAGIMRAGKPVVFGNIGRDPESDAMLLSEPRPLGSGSMPVLLEIAKTKKAKPYLINNHITQSHLHPNSLNCALKVAELLNLKANLETLQNLTLHGRYQKQIINGVLHIADVAHNADAINNLAEKLKQESYQQLHIVLGMLVDKDIEEAVQPLHALNPIYYCVSTEGERGLSAEGLAERLAYSGQVECCENVKGAQKSALQRISENDILLTTGSFHVLN